MTLAVSENDQPWIRTLYYGIDDEMSMYIVTDPNNVHGKIMTRNLKVAFNIFDSHTKITESKLGIQGKGTIAIVEGLVGNTKAIMLWHKANPGIEAKITIQDLLKKVTDTKIFKITPTYLKFFNKQLYGKDEYGIWERNS